MNRNTVKTYTFKGYGEVNIESVVDYNDRKVYYAYFEDSSPASCEGPFDHLPTRQEVFDCLPL